MRQLNPITLILLTRIRFLYSFITTNIRLNAITPKGIEIENPKYSHLKASTMPLNKHTYKPASMGKISQFLTTLAMNPRKLKAIKAALKKEIIVVDIVALIFLSWWIQPFTKMIYYKFLHKNDYFKMDYDKSVISIATDLLSQVSKIASLVYLIDIFDIIFTEMGFRFAIKNDLGQMAATLFYTLWSAYQLKKFKHNLIYKEKRRNMHFPATFFDRILDVFIYMTSTIILVETFKLSLSATIKSLYAFGGAGTLVFTLACKDFATEYLNGMLSLASYKFVKGEKILLGNGTKGVVSRLGWFDMDLLCEDSNLMRIPYSQIGKQTLVNVSRNSNCQIKQTLRFQYKDIDHMEDIIQDIKSEIQVACPMLISDGSRPFRVLMSEFNAQYVSITVNTHHHFKPCSDEYYVTRHNLLEAISRAIKKHNVSLA